MAREILETVIPDTRPSASNTETIRVKFLARSLAPGASAESWLRRFPGGRPRWGRCEYIFDPLCRDYDWVVVYEDLPNGWDEPLSCPAAHTLLITTEPSSIKSYGRGYLGQFGHVLTSQEPWALKHPCAIRRQTGLVWFYGMQSPHGTYDAMLADPTGANIGKTRGIATVCSNKRMGHTLHAARYDFTQALKAAMPGLDVYGHGVRPIADKCEAVDLYRYHLAIENHVAPDHWTEKLADPFLGFALPFYFGAPNAADYFPPESFIPVDIFDFPRALETMRQAMEADEYSRRLPAIREARRLVLEKHGTFPQLSRLIEERHRPHPAPAIPCGRLQARHVIRKRRPLAAVLDAYDKTRLRLGSLIQRRGQTRR